MLADISTGNLIVGSIFLFFLVLAVPLSVIMWWQALKNLRQYKRFGTGKLDFNSIEIEGLPLDATVRVYGEAQGTAKHPDYPDKTFAWYSDDLPDPAARKPTIRIIDSSGETWLDPQGVRFADLDARDALLSAPVEQGFFLENGSKVFVVAQIGQDQTGQRFLHFSPNREQQATLLIDSKKARWTRRASVFFAGIMIFLCLFGALGLGGVLVGCATTPGACHKPSKAT